jgi:TonB-dependent receptor
MLAAPAFGQEAGTSQSNNPVTDLEVIEISGIRGSLNAAANAKRFDSRIVDSIVAEDIGKLPDNNVAEALQRITGVSINRDFGVGDGVSIRGLPQNRVEINGRTTLGDGRNGISFQDVPAEILSAVQVIKSPTPSMIEGALGGTINLKTVRPLKLKDRIISISAKAEYADKTENLAPILNGTYGDKWELDDGGVFGVIVNLSYQDRELRQDEYRSSLEVNPIDLDLDGPNPAVFVVEPRNFSTFIDTEERQRIAANVSMQWAPASNDGMFYIETTLTDRNGKDASFSPNIIQNSALSSPTELAAGFRIDGTGQLVGTTDDDVTFINRTESVFRNTESISAAFGGEWSFDKLQVSGELSYAKSETFIPQTDLRFWGVDPVAEALDPTQRNSFIGQVFYDTDNNSLPIVDVTDDTLWLSRDMFAFRRYENREDRVDNEETALRLDFSYDEPISALKFITSIDAGIRLTSRSFESSRERLFIDNIHTGLLDSDGNPTIIYMNEFPDGTINDYNFNAFRDNSGPLDLENFAMFNPKILRDRDRTLAIVAGLLLGTNKEITDTNSALLPLLDRFAAAEEDTTAAYVQFNVDTEIGGFATSAVFGVRYIETDLTSEAFNNVSGVFVPTQDVNKYDDWLPSLNVTVDLDDGLLFRFAAAEVMRRPDFSQLSPALSLNQDATFGNRGNPSLDPFRATQFDISVEKYWGAGNYVSGAIFYKDVASFFDETEVCLNSPDSVAISNANRRNELCFLDGSGAEPTLDTPTSQIGIPTATQVNGESGSVRGFEIGYQQSFDFLPDMFSGLGMNANYTYADSEDPNGRPLEDISKNTFNLTGYYEKDGIGIRLAYTYRDRFLDDILNGRVRQLGILIDDTVPDPTRGNSFREPIIQLDASISYDINETFTIKADAVNLTGEQIMDTGTNNSLWRVLESDRRYTVGVSARF